MTKEQAIKLAIEALLQSASNDNIIKRRFDYQEAARVLAESSTPPTLGISVSDELATGDRPR